MSLIPVTVITGFLGAGKTTLLKHILHEAHGQRIAVIENEFGEENIDHDILVKEEKETIIQMSNGCVCCTIREDLRSTLSDLAHRHQQKTLNFDRVIIETTGMADPGPVLQTFFMDDEIAQHYLLDGVLTLVDAVHAQQQLNQRQEARRQIGFADQLLISKTDLVSPQALAQLQHRLQHMNPRAPQKNVHWGHIDIAEILDMKGFNLSPTLEWKEPSDCDQHCSHHDHAHEHEHHHEHHHHHHDDDVKSFVYKSHQPFDPMKLEDFLGAIVQIYGPKMFRYKGVLYMKGTTKKVIFQGVHQLMGTDLGPEWKENETKESRMVFIGIDLPRSILEQGLAQCF